MVGRRRENCLLKMESGTVRPIDPEFECSPGKLPFYRNRIARNCLTPRCITMMSPDEHTKSPKKSEVGKYG